MQPDVAGMPQVQAPGRQRMKTMELGKFGLLLRNVAACRFFGGSSAWEDSRNGLPFWQ